MAQLTVRTSDELVRRVRSASVAHGMSMNEFVCAVLDAATDPDLAGGAAARLRERLAQRGLLSVPEPGASGRTRPSRSAVAAARKAAGKGIALSNVVSEGRR